jgi:hypothetical protein
MMHKGLAHLYALRDETGIYKRRKKNNREKVSCQPESSSGVISHRKIR